MRIMRPPSPGDIVELTPASIPPSSSSSDDHDNQQQQQQQSNTGNSSTIQIILSNSPENNSSQLQTITLNSQQQQQQPTGATNPFACNHCHWTSDSEERLLEHICAVHLETRVNREDQGEETSNNTGEQRGGNKQKLKVVRISTGAANRRKQRMPSSTTSAAPQPKTTDDTSASSSSANNETTTSSTTASTAHFHYVCQFLRCSKRFAKLDQLRQHHRGHLNLKPYHCTWPGCAQYFSRRPAALRHIRTSHFKVQREQLPELSAEERAQAHQFVGVVRERVAEEESALDAVRRAKKRIQIGGEPSRKITAAATAAFSSSKRPKPKRRANDEDDEDEIEEENEENCQEEEVMEIEVEEEEPIIEEEAEQLLPVPPNSEPLADDDQQPQLSQSTTCGGGGLSPHRYVCPFPRCADLPARRYDCQFPRCDKVYSRLYALRMHHRSHTKTQPYYCKFPVVIAKDLLEDAQETATTTTAADPAECGETFRRRANAARHVLAKHYGVPKAAQPALSKAEKGRALPYIGERAKLLAREEASLEPLRVNKPRDPSRPPLKYRCGHPGCGKYFPAPGKLLLHQRTHSESLKPFFCRWEGCPKRAVTERATLLKHILREHLGVVALPRRTLLPAEEGAEAEEGEEEVVIGDEEGNQVRFTRPSTAEKPKSNATSSSSAFSEAEKAAAAPYVGVHQHLLEQERRTVLTRTEEVVEEREEEEVTADYYGESGLTYRKKSGGFNFQSFFSVPMSAPFPPVHYGPVFAVQIAVHKID